MARVLLAKPGLDGHDKGIKVLATMLRDAGCEVIYTGLHQTPGRIALAALQEDVDVVGLSMLSGAHLDLTADVIHELAAAGLSDRPVVVGGNVPRKDVVLLENMGVAAVFSTGTPYEDIIDWFLNVPARSG
jgi:methylmalonyl-CoA mutase, C-terminal domain